MRRKIIFKNNTTGQEILLPVTPESYQIDRGVPVQLLDMQNFGEYAMPGHGMTLFTAKLNFLLPRQVYASCNAGTNTNPYHYIEFFQKASDNKQTCRFIVSDTPTVCDVWIENLQYGEQDGTNDVYCTLTVRRYRALGTAQAVSNSTNTAVTASAVRTTTAPTVTAQRYIIQRGDTLSSICRKFYADASLFGKLAVYNSIPNPNLIYDGATLKIPAKEQL